jgi:hypothetical protein
MKKRFILIPGFALLVLVLLFSAQWIRWSRLATHPTVEIDTYTGPTLDIADLRKKYPKNSFNNSYRYFAQAKIQRVYKPGRFPFTYVKSDTLEFTIANETR